MSKPETTPSRLLVVSNRLPVTLKRNPDDPTNPTFCPSSGGLVTALTGMGDLKFSWVGWLGSEVECEEQESIRSKLRHDFNYEPVFLEKKLAEDYYNGFSNSILWPLFHYLFEKEDNFNPVQWEAYKTVNQLFAEVVLKNYRPGDHIWIQDYHLMLLPAILRREIPDAVIGFFLHIPFPSSEIYRTLPVRSEILKGVLASNLIGFHTFDYCRHFLSSCMRTLGLETNASGLMFNGIQVTVGCFPIGIDPQKFVLCLEKDETKERIQALQKQFADKKILIGVDRLDYTKGLPFKLQAFERFLQKYPERKHDTILIQIAVPTREDVQEYKDLITQVNELVGRINSKYGTVDDYPIHYIHNSVPFPELTALYYVSDACIVTALRDGMNLVSLEYVACQKERHGVLLLSEFAGASAYLSGSILINPFALDATADDINSALEMSNQEKQLRFEKNENIVFQQNTASSWGSSFLKELEKAGEPKNFSMIRTPILTKSLLSKFFQGEKRIFFLDYDGTLVNIQKDPKACTPTKDVKELLKKLTANKKNVVYIVSGRSREELDNWLTPFHVGILAEHGMTCRHPDSKDWEDLFEDVDFSWMPTVEAILQHVVDRVAGSSLEKKKTSLCFHYRMVEASYAEWRVNELTQHLNENLSHLPTEIIRGKKVLEVRNQNVNKGCAIKKVLQHLGSIEDFFIFCAGDDRTDEDMFGYLQDNEKALSCFIGETERPTAAKSRLDSPQELIAFLRQNFAENRQA